MYLGMLFAVHFKHYGFWPSAKIKPKQNDLVHAIPLQCMFALSMCILQYLWMGLSQTNMSVEHRYLVKIDSSFHRQLVYA